MNAFRQGLGEIGYVEGRNVIIDYQSAENRADRLPGSERQSSVG
jgi:putative ABC transport system substrate-binding protein